MANKLPEVMQANAEAINRVDKNQAELQNAMRAFTASNKIFSRTADSLNKFAKAQVSKLNPFAKLKDGFDKSFIGQNLARKKEEEQIAKAAGITRDELKLVKAQKELKDSQQAAADQLKTSLEEYGLNTNTFFNQQGASFKLEWLIVMKMEDSNQPDQLLMAL